MCVNIDDCRLIGIDIIILSIFLFISHLVLFVVAIASFYSLLSRRRRHHRCKIISTYQLFYCCFWGARNATVGGLLCCYNES
jgi:hypothetical protein